MPSPSRREEAAALGGEGFESIDAALAAKKFDGALVCTAPLSHAAIIRQLDLLKPIYVRTAAYGHFGRSGFTWERTDKAKALRDAVE